MNRRPYLSDLTDDQWKRLEPHAALLRGSKRGKPREIPLREMVNAMLYLDRTGCQWRMLPHDLPDWRAVHSQFQRWSKGGHLRLLNDAVRRDLRLQEGRNAEPSAGIVDSQSVKAAEFSSVRGYDAGKRIKGIKRHIVVDSMGLLLAVLVHSAGIQDRDGAKTLFLAMKERFSRLAHIWADSSYAGAFIDWVKTTIGWTLEIVKRIAAHEFVALPRRWVVERTFAWLARWRRLNRHYERITETAEAFVYLAMTKIMLARLKPLPRI